MGNVRLPNSIYPTEPHDELTVYLAFICDSAKSAQSSANPSPMTELMPEYGDVATASCPSSRNLETSFNPMSPLPPITTIFITLFAFRLKDIQDVGFHNSSEISG
jgi:hypothetical protein